MAVRMAAIFLVSRRSINPVDLGHSFAAPSEALNGGRELGYEASLLSAVGLCASAPKQPPLNLPTQVHALATATKALATSGPKPA
jgi:hypothetical protein